MLPIKNLSGETHLLTNVKTVRRRRAVNGEKKLEFMVVPGETNEHAWQSVDGESKLDFMGDPYIIKDIEEASVGNRSLKKVDAVHTFFNTMINCYQYKVHSGSQTFFAALTRVFENTPYDFSIVDSFYAQRFENFGQDNCLSLFIDCLERYQAEFRLEGNRVYLETEIGSQTNFQYRWKHNVKSVSKSITTKGLSSVIKGYGGKPSDSGVYPLEVTYLSPNIGLFPDMEYHAEPYYNENITIQATMLEELKKRIVDEPQLSITVDIAETGLQTVNEGDRGYIIYEPMNITVSARVVEVYDTFEYLEGDWKLVKTEVTLSNIKDRLSDVTTRFAQDSKRLERLFGGQEKLPYNVLPEAMRIAAEAINNSLTQIEYPPGQGIVLRDPNNPNYLIRLTSAGIGLSTNGGISYRTAMTGAGIVTNELVAGIIRTNNIQIVGESGLFYWDGNGLYAYDPYDYSKFVRLNSSGLFIAGGAITIQRPDGYTSVNNGIVQSDYAITGSLPPFKDPEIIQGDRYFSTTSQTARSMDFISFRHDARYLRLTVGLYSQNAGVHTHFRVHPTGGRPPIASYTTLNSDGNADEAINGVSLTVDLGPPTGGDISLYLRLASGNTGSKAHGRIIKMWKEG